MVFGKKGWLALCVVLALLLGSVPVAFAAPPAQVTGLAATGVSSGKVVLSWNAQTSDAQYFRVYRSTTSGFTPGTSTLIKSIATNKYQDFMLQAGTTYYYKVIAVNSSGQAGTASAEAQATTKAAAANVHPSLYFYQDELTELRQRKDSPGLWQTWYNAQKSKANTYLSENVSTIAYKDRPVRILSLAMAYVIETSNTSYYNKLIEYMNAMPTDKTTIVSAYTGELYISYGAHAYAVAYDFIYNALSPTDRTTYEDKLQKHAEYLYENVARTTGTTNLNNFVEVMSGGLAVTGAVLRDYNPSGGAKSWGTLYMEKAIDALNQYGLSSHHFKGGGAFVEGESYVAYAYVWAQEGMTALRSVGKADLFSSSYYQNALRYRTRVLMPLARIPLYEDSKASALDHQQWVATSIYEHNDVDYQLRLKWLFDKMTSLYPMEKQFSAYFKYYGNAASAPIPGASYIDPNGGLAFLRTGVDDEDLSLSMASKPYTFNSSHLRPDEGSFEMYAYGAYLVHLPGYDKSSNTAQNNYAVTARALNSISIAGNDLAIAASDGFSEYLTGNSVEYVTAKITAPYGTYGSVARSAIFVKPTASSKGYYLMADNVNVNNSTHTVDWYLHGLSGGTNLTVSGRNATWTVPRLVGTGENVMLHAYVAEPAVNIASQNEATVPEYVDGGIDLTVEADYIKATPTATGSTRFLTVLYPRKASFTAPTFTQESQGVTLNTNDVSFLNTGTGTKTVNGITSGGKTTFARKNGTALDVYLVLDGSSLSYNGGTVGFTATSNADIVMEGLSGSAWIRTAGTTLTLKHASITSASTVKVDGASVSATAASGSVQFTIASTGAHTIQITP